MTVLYWLDIGVGYAFVMLLLATLAGAAAAGAQTLFRTRSRMLADGLLSIVVNLCPEEAHSGAVVAQPGFFSRLQALLLPVKQKLVNPNLWQLTQGLLNDVSVKEPRLAAEVIQREELVLLLLRRAAAAESGPEKVLARVCENLTGKLPAELLTDIESCLVDAEQADPQAPAYLWRVRAFHRAGAAALAGRVFAWYDNTMRRVEDRVNFSARRWSLAFALGICVWMNVNSFALVRELQANQEFRARLAALGEKAAREGGVESPRQTGELLGLGPALNQTGEPSSELGCRLASPGIWLSAVMVSLGTAFWFGLLNRLVGLKSSMKEALDKTRALREADTRGQTSK